MFCGMLSKKIMQWALSLIAYGLIINSSPVDEVNYVVGGVLIDRHAKQAYINSALRLFERLSDKDVVGL